MLLKFIRAQGLNRISVETNTHTHTQSEANTQDLCVRGHSVSSTIESTHRHRNFQASQIEFHLYVFLLFLFISRRFSFWKLPFAW